MYLKEIKENDKFKHHNYIWEAKYNEGVLMLFSDTDGHERWAKIDQDNVKGLIRVNQ